MSRATMAQSAAQKGDAMKCDSLEIR